MKEEKYYKIKAKRFNFLHNKEIQDKTKSISFYSYLHKRKLNVYYIEEDIVIKYNSILDKSNKMNCEIPCITEYIGPLGLSDYIANIYNKQNNKILICNDCYIIDKYDLVEKNELHSPIEVFFKTKKLIRTKKRK